MIRKSQEEMHNLMIDCYYQDVTLDGLQKVDFIRGFTCQNERPRKRREDDNLEDCLLKQILWEREEEEEEEGVRKNSELLFQEHLKIGMKDSFSSRNDRKWWKMKRRRKGEKIWSIWSCVLCWKSVCVNVAFFLSVECHAIEMKWDEKYI